MISNSAGQTTETLGFLLFPGFPMACLTSAIEPLRAANEITGRKEFAWKLIGESAGPVRSSAEVRFDPDMVLEEARGLDYLFFLSGPSANFEDPRRSQAQVRWLDRSGVTIGAFSGGIFPLARTGLMEGRRCSVHWCYEAAFAAEFPRIEATQAAILRDRRRITVSGSGAVFDLMLRLIEERLGRPVMTEVACWFQHPFVRDENAVQTMPVAGAGGTETLLPAPVRAAIALFADHIEDPIQIADVAGAVALSERQLERVFKAATGQTPLRYYRLMRLRRARQRVIFSNASLTEIAQSVGYSSSTELARYYAAAFGIGPREERRSLAGQRGLSGAMPPLSEPRRA
ncbi:GlxA family transcriptional regulator [Albidovulum sediminis]|uniref:Helix-turn-helix domain-containing protein n=1 Tax=Albidovulum sediminis TaxID=3066345 RepID=A0ABT2NPN2_9RHOB|nr:helix-turn-helix domain-containing protein [Defluviimonas sediminis]MCT8330893.1 helix-turn-helix domain-containing protein [Defluviimonas sediminis]